MKKYGGIVLFAAVFLIAAMGFYDGHAKAAEKNITLYNGSSDANDWEDGDIYHVGDYGKIELQMNWYSMVEIARKEFHSSNEKTATVDAAGNFRIVGGGKTFITAKGWDAAGKGGNIKRITEALDPRGFEVHPIASPEPHEKARHYLWRFWTRLPKDGHIAIFDRTWYGRVMVERLEGFCSENDWRRAYNEINEFEKELSDWGAVIVKFWVHIDKDTQLARFNDRQSNPEKQWKITDEDWRNREKWDQYETAVDEMLQKTSTAYAPWHILESVDKKYATLKALRIVIEEIEKALK